MARLQTSLILIPVLAVLAWAGAEYLEQNKPEPRRLPPREVGAVPVLVRELTSEPLSLSVHGYGTLEAAREAALAPELGGRVVSCLKPWNVGSFVKRGELLVGLDVSVLDQEVIAALAGAAEAQASLDSARVELAFAADLVPLAVESLELARREEKRLAGLSEGSYASASQIDGASLARSEADTALGNARAREGLAGAAEARATQSLQASRASLELARERRKLAELRAPFDGYLDRQGPTLGSYLPIGVPVVTLVDTTELRVVLQIPEEQFAGIELGQLAEVIPTARPHESYKGRVIGIGVMASTQLRSLPVEIALVEGIGAPSEGPLESTRLRPGQFVEVSIETRRVAEGIALTREEISWRGGRPFAFIKAPVGEGFEVEARELLIGAQVQGRLWVEAGLQAGEELIIAPIGRLDGGEPCTLRGADGG